MDDCQYSNEGHDLFVIGHSTGPHPILFLQCVGCGATTQLPLTNSEWADYLQCLADAGREWLDDMQRRAVASGQGNEIQATLIETLLGRLRRQVDALDLFDEGDDVPF